MIDTSKYRVEPGSTIEDVDLDAEPLVIGGTRITESEAEKLAERTLSEARRRNLVPGRKSLSGGRSHSPKVQFRVPEAVLEDAERRAEEEGISLSALAREALVDYLSTPAAKPRAKRDRKRPAAAT